MILGADKGSFRNTRNGNGMWVDTRRRRCGADPPRKESETTGALSSMALSLRSSSATNVFCIAAKTLSSSELGMIKIDFTYADRYVPKRAAIMLSSPHFEIEGL